MKSSIIPLGIVIISLFGFLVIATFYADKSQLIYTGKEMHKLLLQVDYEIDAIQFGALNEPILIDIRDRDAYRLSSVDSAINMPLSDILSEEYKSILSSEFPKVFIAHEPIDAHETWMLLTQLGYTDLFIIDAKLLGISDPISDYPL